MSNRRWSLSARATLLWLAAVALVGGITVASGVAAADSRAKIDTTLNQLGPIRTLSEQLLSSVVNQETAIRGFAVSGNADDLVPYHDGLAAERTEAEQLRASLIEANRLDLSDLVDQAERQSAAWRLAVAEPVIAAGQAGDLAKAQTFITNGARQQFDAIRATIQQLQDGISEFRQGQTDEAWRSVDTTTSLLYVFGAVVLIVGILVLFGLRRLVTGPVMELANQVRAVAAGDYDREIKAGGAPELTRLAEDVDMMRARIAAELHEVDSARSRLESAYAELNRLNAELELRAAELGRSNRDLEQFAYVASHDLQEPLRKVASFCQLLQRRYAGRLDEKADQYITFAVDGAQRMQQLINDLLAFSRIGRGTSNFTDVDLGAVVTDSIAQLEYQLKQNGGEVVVHDLPMLRGEPALLSALVTNLLGNAIKFRRPGVSPKVDISAELAGDQWRITCSDNGIGIDPGYAEKVFVIFQRLQPRDQYAGTGIGLAIAKKIVEYHGGEIWVDEREPGSGASISFTLPVDPTAAPIAPVSPAAPDATDTALPDSAEIAQLTA